MQGQACVDIHSPCPAIHFQLGCSTKWMIVSVDARTGLLLLAGAMEVMWNVAGIFVVHIVLGRLIMVGDCLLTVVAQAR